MCVCAHAYVCVCACECVCVHVNSQRDCCCKKCSAKCFLDQRQMRHLKHLIHIMMNETHGLEIAKYISFSMIFVQNINNRIVHIDTCARN